MKTEAAEDIRRIFDGQDSDTAERHLKVAVQKYARIAPMLADWMEINLSEGLSCLRFRVCIRKDYEHPTRLKGSVRRSSGVPRLCGSLPAKTPVPAVLMEFSEDWEYGRIYLNMENTLAFITGKAS